MSKSNDSKFVVGGIAFILVLIGFMAGEKYKTWHYEQIEPLPTIEKNIALESFDSAIKEFYETGYCKGMPITRGIIDDRKTGQAFNFVSCGLRLTMVLNYKGEYMYFIDERDSVPLGVVRYE